MPSAVCPTFITASSTDKPSPRAMPIWKFLLKGEVQVTKRSPTPLNPRNVMGLAPRHAEKRLISAKLLVIKTLIVF